MTVLFVPFLAGIFVRRCKEIYICGSKKENLQPKSNFKMFRFMYRSAPLESNPLLFVIF